MWFHISRLKLQQWLQNCLPRWWQHHILLLWVFPRTFSLRKGYKINICTQNPRRSKTQKIRSNFNFRREAATVVAFGPSSRSEERKRLAEIVIRRFNSRVALLNIVALRLRQTQGAELYWLFGHSGETRVLSNIPGLFCPFPENFRSYRLSENDSWLLFGTQNDRH